MLVIDGVEMVDVREAARLAHRTPETVRRWIWSGRLAATRHGNRLLIDRRELIRAAGGDAAGESTYTLRQWADEVRAGSRPGRREASARDLVLDDRADRDTGAGR